MCSCFDLALWFRVLIFHSRICFLAWLLVNSSAWDSSSCGRNSPTPNAASSFVFSPPLSYPFTSHATWSTLPELTCQKLKRFKVAHKMSSQQPHVKWENTQAQRFVFGRLPRKDLSFKNTGSAAPRGSTRGVTASKFFCLTRHEFFAVGL